MRTVATLLLASVLAGSAAAAPPARGKLLYERSGVIERSNLSVTQDTFYRYNECRGTDLNGTETNGLSAAVLDVSRYRAQYLSVAFTDELPIGGFYQVVFYSHDCQLLTDELSKTPVKSQEGRIPTRASWLMLGHSAGTGDPLGSVNTGGQLMWKITVHALPPLVPPPPKKALCQQVRDPKGDEPDAQFDVLSADVAVDAAAVTVGVRLAALDDSDTNAPVRAYLVEFAVPDGRTFFFGMLQEYAGYGGFTAVAGTKDATGYHRLSVDRFGWYDTKTHEMRVSVPLAGPDKNRSLGTVAKFDRGKRLTGITVRTISGPLDHPQLVDERDAASTKTPYVIGTATCLQRVVD